MDQTTEGVILSCFDLRPSLPLASLANEETQSKQINKEIIQRSSTVITYQATGTADPQTLLCHNQPGLLGNRLSYLK